MSANIKTDDHFVWPLKAFEKNAKDWNPKSTGIASVTNCLFLNRHVLEREKNERFFAIY
jgi:hypothetical protein